MNSTLSIDDSFSFGNDSGTGTVYINSNGILVLTKSGGTNPIFVLASSISIVKKSNQQILYANKNSYFLKEFFRFNNKDNKVLDNMGNHIHNHNAE